MRYAQTCCTEIKGRGHIPLFVGGTGFYIDSFFQGLSDIPDIDPSVRDEIRDDIGKRGMDSLYEELAAVDSSFAGKIHPNDRQRIIRGLEVYRGTGKPLSDYYSGRTGYESGETRYIGIHVDRETLIERIKSRVDGMIEAGFVKEVENLRNMGYGPGLKSMKSIGYAELNQYLDGQMSLDEAVENIKIETRRYAKRQMTWFRRNKKINWFQYDERDTISSCVEDWFMNKNK